MKAKKTQKNDPIVNLVILSTGREAIASASPVVAAAGAAAGAAVVAMTRKMLALLEGLEA